MRIEIYADGSAQTSATAGGWGSVIVIDGIKHKELSGHLVSATNNDAELIAALKGLEYTLEYICSFQGSFSIENEVTLISDSEIVLNWANGKYRFKQIDKMPLYDSLMRLMKKMKVQTLWVRGHSGNVWNERCDRLANLARKQIQEVPNDRIENKIQSSIGSKKKGTASVYYKGQLMVLDFEAGIIETYNRDAHGKRGSMIEIREGKER